MSGLAPGPVGSSAAQLIKFDGDPLVSPERNPADIHHLTGIKGGAGVSPQAMVDAAYPALFDLSGKVAIITGGSEGIGFGVAELLGRGGVQVIVASRSEGKVDLATAQLRALGLRAEGVPTDVRDPAAVAHLVDWVMSRFGQLDILVNSAGGAFGDSYRMGPILSLSEEDFLEGYRSNVIGLVSCSKAAALAMERGGGGSIVHISSPAGRWAHPNRMAAYGASKAAVNNLTRSMALEFAPRIRVNAVLPGHVETPRTKANRTPERVAAAIRDSASGRLGTPADIAGAVCFLCSPAASWISGVLLDIDGGDTRGRARE